MDQFFDIRTLSLMMGVVSIAFGVGMLYLYLYYKTYSGFFFWTLGTMFAGVGGILLCLRGYIPAWLSVITANTFIVFFFSCISWGLEKFTAQKSVRWPDYALLCLFLAAFFAFTYIKPDVEARIVVVCFVICFFCLKACWILQRNDAQIRFRFLLYTLLLSAFWYFLRGFTTIFSPLESADFMKAGNFQALTFIVFISTQILVTIGLLLANYHRMDSELSESAKSLIDSEERFRSLSDAAFEGIVLMKDRTILEGNAAICRALGYQPEEIIDKNVTDFVAPEEKENVKRKILAGYDQPYESSCLKKDGSVLPVEIQGRNFSYKGEQVRVTAVRDISERKQAEKALQQANQKLMDMAMQDGLTQVANRRNFDMKLDAEWRRMMRMNKSMSLLIFDVDNFKLYNDTYGHLAGDSCLRAIAGKAVPYFRRPGDLFARYGGEEFAAILPDTSCEGALGLAEKVRHDIQAMEFKHEASPDSNFVTVSCGVASLVPTESISPQVLLEIADKALYEAKDSGRNKVVCRSLN